MNSKLFIVFWFIVVINAGLANADSTESFNSIVGEFWSQLCATILRNKEKFNQIVMAISNIFQSSFAREEPSNFEDHDYTTLTRAQCDHFDGKALDSMNYFDNLLYKQLAAEKSNENIFFSPISAHFILTLIAKGATGATFEELSQLLGLENKINGVLCDYKNVLFYEIKNLRDIILNFSSHIYSRESLNLKSAFKNVVRNIDPNALKNFTDSNKAIEEINSLVVHETRGKIRELLDRDDLDDSTQMIFLNAIYFEGEWKQEFDISRTSQEIFYSIEGTKFVDTMKLEGEFIYGYNNGITYLELPYKNPKLKMTIVMPPEYVSLVEARKFIDDSKKSSYLTEISLSFPKFKFSSDIDFNKLLKNLGAGRIFSTDAELYGISESHLQVSKMKQKSFIDVDEHGGKAAALTADNLFHGYSDQYAPIEVKINRPFYFFINYNEHLLFEGQIVDPEVLD